MDNPKDAKPLEMPPVLAHVQATVDKLVACETIKAAIEAVVAAAGPAPFSALRSRTAAAGRRVPLKGAALRHAADPKSRLVVVWPTGRHRWSLRHDTFVRRRAAANRD